MNSQLGSYNPRHVAYSAVGPRLSEKRSKAIDISALIDGDARAWDRFVRSAGPIMKGVIYRLLSKSGREHESEDVLQAAFLKLVRGDYRLLRRFDPRRASLSTYLGVIATSVAVDHLRRAAPVQPSSAELDGVTAATPFIEPVEGLSFPEGLLTARQELILRMLYEDDLSVPEIAVLLQIEAQTVRSLRHKAAVRLREQWARLCDGG